MSTGEAIAELFAGLFGACFGGFLMYQATRPNVHPWLRSWWTKYLEESEAMNKIMCRVVGTGFILAGILMMVQSIAALFQ